MEGIDTTAMIDGMLSAGDYDASAYVANWDFNAMSAGYDFSQYATAASDAASSVDWGTIANYGGLAAKAAGSAFFGDTSSGGRGGSRIGQIPRNIVDRNLTQPKGSFDAGKAQAVKSADPNGIYAQWMARLQAFARKG